MRDDGAPRTAGYFDFVYSDCSTRLREREAAEDATSLIFAHALDRLTTCHNATCRRFELPLAALPVDQLPGSR